MCVLLGLVCRRLTVRGCGYLRNAWFLECLRREYQKSLGTLVILQDLRRKASPRLGSDLKLRAAAARAVFTLLVRTVTNKAESRGGSATSFRDKLTI